MSKTVLEAKAAGDAARKMCKSLLEGKTVMENMQMVDQNVVDLFNSLASCQDCLQVMEESTLSPEDEACKQQLAEALETFKGAVPAASESYEVFKNFLAEQMIMGQDGTTNNTPPSFLLSLHQKDRLFTMLGPTFYTGLWSHGV